MNDILFGLLHLTVMAAKLCRRGGVRAVMAENLLLKHQLIVLRRGRRRAPNLTRIDRMLGGFWSFFLNPRASEPSRSLSARRRSWRFITPWCVTSTADCSHQGRPRGSLGREAPMRPSFGPSST